MTPAQWAIWEADIEATLVSEYGDNWRELHGITQNEWGQFTCNLCGKTLVDLGRVQQHANTRKHMNKIWAYNPVLHLGILDADARWQPPPPDSPPPQRAQPPPPAQPPPTGQRAQPPPPPPAQ